jgi:Gas vesicle protein G
VIIVDRLLVGGISFVLGRIAEAVDAERNNEETLREELLAAQMRLELGEIDEAEFERVERAVLQGMREIRERRGEGKRRVGGKIAVESVEAKLGRDEEPER